MNKNVSKRQRNGAGIEGLIEGTSGIKGKYVVEKS